MHTHLVTVEVFPLLPLDIEPIVETVELRSNSSKEEDIAEKIAGYSNSPMSKIMDKYDLQIVRDFKIIRVEEINKPNVKKHIDRKIVGPTKRFDEIYGYWINDTGELVPVLDMCGHMRINRFGYEDGWIAVITHNENDLSFRFWQTRVSKPALVTLLDVIRRSNYPMYHCDFGLETESFSKNITSKVDVNKKIRELLKEKCDA